MAALPSDQRTDRSVQALYVGCDRLDFLVTHFPGNIAHHPASIILALTALEGFELIFNIFRMLPAQCREVGCGVARASRTVTTNTGSDSRGGVTTTVEFLSGLDQ